jgi:aryl-alcohol dehydrogenase-like predicted oxidoreductase
MDDSMSRRPFGSTSFQGTPIGLGLAALGRPGYINLGHGDDLDGRRDVDQLRAHTHDVLDAAWKLGVRYFDAARSYGRAEEFLGQWLQARGITPGEVAVGSKWGYTYTADWRVDAEVHEVKDHSLEVFERQWPETEERLGSHLDLYQIHSATLKTGVLDDPDVMSALVRLKETEGIAIGLSLSGPRQADTLERAVEVTVDGTRVFDAVQATWNILEPSAGPMLQAASEAGLGVIVKEALANGRLTPRNDRPAFADTYATLEDQAERLGAPVDAFALAAVIAQPWSDIVLSGAATTSQLRSNLQAIQIEWDDEAHDTTSGMAESPAQYWETRGDLDWN